MDLKEIKAQMSKLTAEMAKIEAKRETEQDNETLNVLAEEFEAKSARFDELELAAEKAKKELRRKAVMDELNEIEAKTAVLEDKTVADVADTEHNENAWQRKLDAASRAYMLEGKTGLSEVAMREGDNVIAAIKMEGKDSGIKVPSYIRDHILYNTYANMVAKGTYPVITSDATGSQSGGGSLVPNSFIPELYKIPQIQTRLVDRCWVKRATTGTARFPRLTQSTNAFGVAVSWGSEGASLGNDNPAFNEVTVATHRLGAYSQISQKELRENAVGVEAELASMFRGAIDREITTVILYGNGSSQPLGINTATSIAAGVNLVGREAAGAVSYVDLVNLQFAVAEGVMDEGIFLMKPGASGALKYISALDDTAGRPVMRSVDYGWAQGALPRLAGSEYMKIVPNGASRMSLGLRGDVTFGSFRNYGVCFSGYVSIDVSDQFAFDKGLMTYRVMVYVGGRPLGDDCFSVLGDSSAISSSSSSSSS